MKKAFISIFLSVLLAAFLLPMTSAAADAVTYINSIGVANSCKSYTIINSSNKPETLNTGWYVVVGDADYTSSGTKTNGITVNGDVNLILTDGCSLTVTGSYENAGICVSGDDNSLTIYGQNEGTGKLKAKGGDCGSGIGGGYKGDGSNITINGGTVTATGGVLAAGIGGGKYGSGSNITITDGTVTAIGGNYGSGIGGGYNGAGNNIIIIDGYISVYCNGASSIGGGLNKGGSEIVIYGGHFANYPDENYIPKCFSIVTDTDNEDYQYAISASYMTADGKLANCISYKLINHSNMPIIWDTGYYVVCEDVDYTLDGTLTYGITVNGEVHLIVGDGYTLTVCGDSGEAGICVSGTGNSLTIYGQKGGTGTIKATGGEYGAGIGGGYKCDGNNITINGGIVDAKGGDFAAGIGGGEMGNGSNITITDGTVTATGGVLAAGIGGGCKNLKYGGGDGNYITITGGYINANSGGYDAENIGVGDSGCANEILLYGGYYTAYQNSMYLAYGYCILLNTDSDTKDTYVYKVDKVTYITAEKVSKTCDDFTIISAEYKPTELLGNWWYVVCGNVEYTCGIKVTGDVNLILTDGSKLTVEGEEKKAGIAVGGTSSLTVYCQSEGTGKLVAYGGDSGSGIGGGLNGFGKNITINGGMITAVGGIYASGIGGGNGGDGDNITINGGTVNASGGDYGAGIGGGSGGSGKNITITGGTVEAYGCYYCSAGIGGGCSGDGSNITITGGTVTAIGTDYATGIGGGYGYAGYGGNGSNITISGGYINAESGADAENIGAGYNGSASNIVLRGGHYSAPVNENYMEEWCCTVTDENDSDYPYAVGVKYIAADKKSSTCISYSIVDSDNMPTTWKAGWYVVSGTVNYTSGITVSGDVHMILIDGSFIKVQGATGKAGICVSGDDKSLTIYSQTNGTGKLEAIGGDFGAGIGGGTGSDGGNITFNGGNIVANGGVKAAGIGSGCNNNGSDVVATPSIIIGNNITVNGGIISAEGGTYGAGIGGGYYANGNNITITGGTVTATGGDYGAGIGGGSNGYGSNITINGGEVTATSVSYGAGIGGGTDSYGSNIAINGGKVTAISGWCGAGIGGGNNGNGDIIKITGGYISAHGDGNASDDIGAGCNGSKSNISLSGGCYVQVPEFSYLPSGYYYYSNTDSTSKVDYPYEVGKLVYISEDGTEKACGKFVFIYDGNMPSVLTDGWYVVLKNATYTNSITVSGKVNLILTDESTLTVQGENGKAGINVSGVGNYLTIYGQKNGEGKLITTGGENGAGIGGGAECNGSSITIIGGTVMANGGKYGAGIGGGLEGDSINITITGGTVTATGGDNGAGIGGGYVGNGSYITISGGTITATGGIGGAGIGGGYGNDFGGNGRDITITGGYINATSGAGAEDIGAGAVGSGNNIKLCGGYYAKYPKYEYVASGYTVDNNGIYGYNYRIISNNGAYITSDGKASICDTYTVIDSTNKPTTWNTGWYVVCGSVNYTSSITVSGNVNLILADECSLTIQGQKNCAGIIVNGTENSFTIYGQYCGTGKLNVTGGQFGAGIGGSDYNSGNNITINGGIVTATGGFYGAGIGGGFNGSGSNITINGGTVTANGGYESAGIGGGMGANGSNITITGGTVTATSTYCGAGIGGGVRSYGCNITITAGNINACGESSANIGSGWGGGTSSNIKLSGGCYTNKPDSRILADGYSVVNNADVSSAANYPYAVLEPVTYITPDGKENVCTSYIPINSGNLPTQLTSCWYFVSGDADYTYGGTVEDGIITVGDAKLILADGCSLTVKGAKYEAGILVNKEDNSLTIYGQTEGTGKLTSTGGTYCAGIGSDCNRTCNNIKIFGGYISATGGSSAESIGAGMNGSANEIELCGGYYANNPNSSYVVNGYAIIRNKDNNTSADYPYAVKLYYFNSDGEISACDEFIIMDSENMPTELSSGWYVVFGDADYTSSGTKTNGITVNGDVNLILTDGCSLKVKGAAGKAGICVSGDSNSLTIYCQTEGTGKLEATGGKDGAGIGGGNSGSGNNITINGGIITATGTVGSNVNYIKLSDGTIIGSFEMSAYGGAGIGGGSYGSGSAITINGGTVTAASTGYAAGIGGGYNGSGSNITITGGTVTANGGENGAGIGGGDNGSGNNIVITGGYINSTTVYSSAEAIGAGQSGIASNISIKGGYYANEPNNVSVGYISVSYDNSDYPYTVIHVINTDCNGDGKTNITDAVYVLWSVMGKDGYTLDAYNHDYDGDGEVNASDAVYLLWHIFYPEEYPIV